MSCICNRCPATRPPVEKYPVAHTYTGFKIPMRPDAKLIWVGIGAKARQQSLDTLKVGDVTEWGEIIRIESAGVSDGLLR